LSKVDEEIEQKVNKDYVSQIFTVLQQLKVEALVSTGDPENMQKAV